MSYDTENIIYSNTHSIEIINRNGTNSVRSILVKISRQTKCLQVKLRDLNDFSFNFTANIDWAAFESMKSEQCLEICYEELSTQLVDLLKQTLSKEMLLRLEHHDINCKMVFYERSKIKSLIFLIINLSLTNQREIIDEMSCNITQLKELNNSINLQVSTLKSQVHEKDMLLHTALTTNHHLEKQFLQDVKFVEEVFTKNSDKLQKMLSCKVENMYRRHANLLKDIEKLKRGNAFRETLYSQTLLELDKNKTENLVNVNTIQELKREICVLNNGKTQNEKIISEQRQDLIGKVKEIDSLNSTISELRNDIQEAAKIIAQKSQTHDEIAKDLVQANTMLVNFNNQYDLMSKEMDQLRQIITAQEETVEHKSVQIKQLSSDFDEYKKQFNIENIGQLKMELHKAKERVEELEKTNREAAKINGLLTKKLAAGDGYEPRNLNWMHPK